MEVFQRIDSPEQIIFQLGYFDIFLTIKLMRQIELTIELIKVYWAQLTSFVLQVIVLIAQVCYFSPLFGYSLF